MGLLGAKKPGYPDTAFVKKPLNFNNKNVIFIHNKISPDKRRF
jgi:hypothetical protein